MDWKPRHGEEGGSNRCLSRCLITAKLVRSVNGFDYLYPAQLAGYYKKKKKPTSKGKELQTELLLHGLILNTR